MSALARLRNRLNEVPEEEEEPDNTADITDHGTWMGRIIDTGNKPEEWLQYTEFMKETVQGNSDATIYHSYISNLYARAIKAVDADAYKENRAYAQLLINCAKFKSTYSVEDARSLLHFARNKVKKFAVVHIAAAQLEVSQGSTVKGKRILEKGRQMGALPPDLLSRALTNLICGNKELTSETDMQYQSPVSLVAENPLYTDFPQSTRPERHLSDSGNEDTAGSTDKVVFKMPAPSQKSSNQPVTPTKNHNKVGEMSTFNLDSSSYILDSTGYSDGTVSFKPRAKAQRVINQAGGSSDEADTLPLAAESSTLKPLYTRALKSYNSTPDCKGPGVLSFFSHRKPNGSRNYPTVTVEQPEETQVDKIEDFMSPRGSLKSPGIQKRNLGKPMRVKRTSLSQLREGMNSDDEDDTDNFQMNPLPETEVLKENILGYATTSDPRGAGPVARKDVTVAKREEAVARSEEDMDQGIQPIVEHDDPNQDMTEMSNDSGVETNLLDQRIDADSSRARLPSADTIALGLAQKQKGSVAEEGLIRKSAPSGTHPLFQQSALPPLQLKQTSSSRAQNTPAIKQQNSAQPQITVPKNQSNSDVNPNIKQSESFQNQPKPQPVSSHPLAQAKPPLPPHSQAQINQNQVQMKQSQTVTQTKALSSRQQPTPLHQNIELEASANTNLSNKPGNMGTAGSVPSNHNHPAAANQLHPIQCSVPPHSMPSNQQMSSNRNQALSNSQQASSNTNQVPSLSNNLQMPLAANQPLVTPSHHPAAPYSNPSNCHQVPSNQPYLPVPGIMGQMPVQNVPIPAPRTYQGQLQGNGSMPGQAGMPMQMPISYGPTPGRQAEVLTIKGRMYTVLRLLGRGGSSKVYETLDDNYSLRAVKCVNLEGLDDMSINSYMNEIKLLQRLQHSSKVVKLFDFEHREDANILYVVMERGDTDLASHFRQRNKSGGNDALMQKFYWKEMLKAVRDLHKEGIVHSDLKPANFLLVQGELKLIDFGISNAIHQDMTSVTINQQVGTLNYMSPETIQDSCGGSQVDENGKVRPKFKIGVKSDVWSLGCILYNLVYGKTPFHQIPNSMLKLQAIINPNHQINFPETVDEGLRQVLMKCLRRDPKERPSIDELLVMAT